MTVQAKICGLTTVEAVRAAEEGGAAMLGFVFYAPSPRNISAADAAEITKETTLPKVAVMVDPTDAAINEMLENFTPDYIQLHGSESVERVKDVQAAFGIPVMKAVSIASAADVITAKAYEGIVEYVLLDAKGLKGGLPGGNGVPFDWELLKNADIQVPWLLSGGLNTTNVAQAVGVTGATLVDVSSGVEDAPGEKNVEKIKTFLEVVAGL
jgi:phosphoribosylanthranilate isomerase